jgi:hypothetical protein
MAAPLQIGRDAQEHLSRCHALTRPMQQDIVVANHRGGACHIANHGVVMAAGSLAKQC